MTEYVVTEDENSPPGGYGIAAFIGKAPVKNIPGVFVSRADAEAAADLLNGLGVELCHMEDNIEDYLTDFSL